MPENIAVAAFVVGAVMLLISIVGGKFKIFGAEVSTMAGTTGRVLAGVLGTMLIGFGLYNSAGKFEQANANQVEESNKLSVEQLQQSSVKPVQETKSEALPAYFVLKTLTCIN